MKFNEEYAEIGMGHRGVNTNLKVSVNTNDSAGPGSHWHSVQELRPLGCEQGGAFVRCHRSAEAPGTFAKP